MAAKSTKRQRPAVEASSPFPTDLTTFRPMKVDALDLAFGPRSVSAFLPPRDQLPDEYRAQRGPWCELAHEWFFNGLKQERLVAKPGIDKTQAIAHCSVIMRSWEPKHEHKIGGVGFLMSLWFEPATELPGGSK